MVNGCVISSLLFNITSLYAFYLGKYDFMIVNIFIFVISLINHKYECKNYHINIFDKCVGSLGYIYYVFVGLMVCSPIELFLIMNVVLQAYIISIKTYACNDGKDWKTFHMYFHLIANICAIIIIQRSVAI